MHLMQEIYDGIWNPGSQCVRSRCTDVQLEQRRKSGIVTQEHRVKGLSLNGSKVHEA